MYDHIYFIPVRLIVPSRQSWTLVPYDNKAILILLVETKRIKYAFIALSVPNSVDFDQTAHIQELSDLCLQPFVRPINPFGMFFDL